jgi:endoglucanase
VIVHPSASSAARPAGARISSPGGWYDAGDYNKYIVNSGISTYTLLALVEQYTGASVLLQTNIPESGDGMADLMNEALWNLRWMRTMQDPDDGGVYHKLTNAEFDKFVMPSEARSTRYVVQKSTAATLDFAAVAAHAALIVPAFPQQLPGLADSLVAEARAAWGWARQHPDSIYDQRRLNAHYQPHINTGAYDDSRLDDELRWAAAELYLATREDSFLVVAAPLAPPALDLPDWQSVRTLGVYSLLEHQRDLPRSFDADSLRGRFLAWVRPLALRTRESAYGVSMREPGDFAWGSNAVAANQGMAFVHAFRQTRDTMYLRAAVASADYVLGRNATGYSFVTGLGSKTPRFPHHRPSRADTVRAPVPGMVVGGPNPGQQDNCPGYPTRIPAKSYVDSTCAYAANEIAINWNAPFVYLVGALDAIYSRLP